MKSFNKILLFIFILIFLFSCYEQIIVVNQDDNTGIITYNITYYNEYSNFISYLNEVHNIDLNTSILFNKRDLENLISKNKIVKLIKYLPKELVNGRSVEASLTYNEFKDFPKQTPYLYFPVHVFEENKVVNYSTDIVLFNLDETKSIKNIYNNLGKDEKELIDSYISLMNFKIIYKTAKAITASNIGSLSKDKKELVYETTLFDIINSKDEISIKISFRK